MVTHPSILLIEDSPGKCELFCLVLAQTGLDVALHTGIKTAPEVLQLAKQRYKLGLDTVVEVTQPEIAITAAQTRLAEAQYDYKIAEVTLAYSARGRGQLEIDSAIH